MAEIARPTVPTVLPPEYGTPLTAAQAAQMMKAAEDCANAEGWPMVIAIVDSTGSLLMLHRHDNAQRASVDIAIAKATCAVNFRRETRVFEELVAGGGLGTRLLAMPGMTPLEGGLPVLLNGKVVGGIGVSGMHSTQDAFVAKHGLAAIGAL
ncbi:heme-binding protein [Limnobacter humi]|uniref:Heme-binding protein n=1 Tax=Limnobacter humi TaxID=1778671 RepID=A0ABT1WHL4_9BURK|nr:heme-binding protein [Limnobacter humi]MCQ8897019.1 heme-binding protein [Limnobacter humi]